jgi:Alternative complex III, ActD subunit
MSHDAHAPTLHGIMAEFTTPTALVEATNKARLQGYRQMDAYTPIPIEELNDALGLRRTRLPRLVLLGGILGGTAGFGLEYWASVIAYPMNIGARPYNSWPHFIPVTFELTVLGAALTCFVGMWALNKLPQPYHPVFNVPAFDRASSDRFFLCIEATDPRFEAHETRAFLESLHPVGVSDVAS